MKSSCKDSAVELISAGADVNVSDSFNNTALIWAAIKDDLEIVNALIQAGADVNKPG